MERGNHDQPKPSKPRPGDSNEKKLKYIRAYFAHHLSRPPESPEIQTLDLRFTGTGTDLYYATGDELEHYLGHYVVALDMFFLIFKYHLTAV
jgi:hypothetical protein